MATRALVADVKRVITILVAAFCLNNVPSFANVLVDRARNSRPVDTAGHGGRDSDINATLTGVLKTLTDASLNEDLYFLDAVQQHMLALRNDIFVNITEQSVNGMNEIMDRRRGLASHRYRASYGDIDALEREIETLKDELDYFDTTDPFVWTTHGGRPRPPDITEQQQMLFIEPLTRIDECHKFFGQVADAGADAYQLFQDGTLNKPFKCGPHDAPQRYEIYEFNPRKEWWNPGHGKFSSANAPVPIFVRDMTTHKTWPYMIKKQDAGPANDYLAMKMAEWLRGLFTTLYPGPGGPGAPIIEVYGVVPGRQPHYAGPGVGDDWWTESNVKKMYYFMPYQLNFGGGWVDGVKGPDGTTYPFLNAMQKGNAAASRCDCGANKQRLLQSLRGAFIQQLLTGAKDRHKDNVAITKDCTVMNVDYTWFMGKRPGGLAYTSCKTFVTMYNDILKEYLMAVNMEDDFKDQLYEDIVRLRAHFGWISDGGETVAIGGDGSTAYGIPTKYGHVGNDWYNPVRTDWRLFSTFAATFGAGAEGEWKASKWMAMAHCTKGKDKSDHRIPFIEYASWVLFGDKTYGKHRPPQIPVSKDDFKEQLETDKKCVNRKMWEHARSTNWGSLLASKKKEAWFTEKAHAFYVRAPAARKVFEAAKRKLEGTLNDWIQPQDTCAR